MKEKTKKEIIKCINECLGVEFKDNQFVSIFNYRDAIILWSIAIILFIIIFKMN